MQEEWGTTLVRTAYQRWFHFGEENGSEPNMRTALEACGQNYDRVMKKVSGVKIRRDPEHETDEARRLGLFGSPTFAVGTELFLGDDHLEDAIQWACQGRLNADQVERPAIIRRSCARSLQLAFPHSVSLDGRKDLPKRARARRSD